MTDMSDVAHTNDGPRHAGTADEPWFDPDAPQCPATVKPYPTHHALASIENRCVLPAGHSGHHGSDFGDDWPGGTP